MIRQNEANKIRQRNGFCQLDFFTTGEGLDG